MNSNINDLRSRLLRGLGAGAAGQAINLISRLSLPILFLKAWNPAVYGEWLVLTALTAHLVFSDAGVGLYAVNRMTEQYAKGDLFNLRATFHTAMSLFLLAPIIIFLLFSAVAVSVDAVRILKVEVMPRQAAYIVLFATAAQMALSLPTSLLMSVYRAVGRYPRGAMMANCLQLAQLTTLSVALYVNAAPALLALIQLAPIVLIAIAVIVDLNRLMPELQILSLSRASKNVAHEFVRPSSHFFSIQLSLGLAVQGVLVIAGTILGPIQTVVFATMRTLCNAAKSVFGLVTATAWPEMTRLGAVQNNGDLLILLRGVLRTTMSAATFFAVLISAFGERVYELWLSGSVPYDPGVMRLFLVFLLQQVYWHTSMNFLMAVGAQRILSYAMSASALLSLLLAYICGSGRDSANLDAML